jgi:retron-type reverse transcriptase
VAGILNKEIMPKTYNKLWDKVIDWENLHQAYLGASKGKRFQKDVLEFNSNLEENLINIQNHLIWKSWTPGQFRSFMVYEPKQRYIQAPPFKDRIVHHALVQVIEPLLERKFIHHSYACRAGKGNHAAVLQLQDYLREAGGKWEKIYVLKADISKYFPSIKHGILLQILKRTIRDKDVLWLCESIIRHCGEDGQGIPVGALTSQLFANVYLDQLDHFLKDEHGVKSYVRYMDDWIVLAPEKADLWGILKKATGFLNFSLELKLNPKTSIFPVSHGCDFCGYRIWPTHLLPRKRNVKRAKLKFKKLAGLYFQGQVTLEDITPFVMSFLGYMKHCSSFKTVSSVLGGFVLQKIG